MSTRMMEWGIANPSYMGTACVTPSPASRTTPVVRPVAYLSGKKHISVWGRCFWARKQHMMSGCKEILELTNWALPAWRWTALERWRSRRKPLPPVLGFYWGSAVLRSVVRDAKIKMRDNKFTSLKMKSVLCQSNVWNTQGHTSSEKVCSCSFEYTYCQMRSISFQSFTIPCSIG